jgi:hypothetical protein
MPQHRRSEKLPQRLIDKITASEEHSFFGQLHLVPGGGLRGARVGLLKPKHEKASRGKPIDVQYTFKDHVITRTEFLRDSIAVPLHIAHFDPETGFRIGNSLDLY